MNIQSAIKKGQLILESKKIKTAELDSYVLMSKAINKERKFLILNSEEKISKKNLENFNTLIEQRANGKPVAYLIEKKDFWKYEFIVNKDVLIPRPDTETLVEEVLKLTKNKNKLRLLDIGIVRLYTFLNLKKKKLLGWYDISNKSLNICKVNSIN